MNRAPGFWYSEDYFFKLLNSLVLQFNLILKTLLNDLMFFVFKCVVILKFFFFLNLLPLYRYSRICKVINGTLILLNRQWSKPHPVILWLCDWKCFPSLVLSFSKMRWWFPFLKFLLAFKRQWFFFLPFSTSCQIVPRIL